MKCVQEFELKFYNTYLDALLDEKYFIKTLEIENNTLPNTVSIEIDGKIKKYRLKPFKRQTSGSNYLENVFVLIC
jgi:cell fate regulator YaaT (PSP1 superfamily)